MAQSHWPRRIAGSVAGLIAAAALMALPSALRAQGPVAQQVAAAKKPVTAQQMADYHRKLAAYKAVRDKFDAEAEAYWTAIADKRRTRNAKRRNNDAIAAHDYVLTQPPLYTGPPRPVDPSEPEKPTKPRRAIPVAEDFLKHAAEQFHFVPRRPRTEIEFKQAYARVAQTAGLTRDQAVRVYSFEAGGNGKYDVQAGLESARPNARAISTALGYNQLLTTNTVELLAEQGHGILKALESAAARMQGSQRTAMDHKIAIVRKMVAFCKSVPDQWSAHEKLGVTPQGIGIHALNLDVDVGPWLQTHKLLTSVDFAKRKGYTARLTAAELEMMNLTGDGTGFDMVSMPQALRMVVPTSNFFQRTGYERNPVAIRNNTVAKLLAATDARMDRESTMPGARDMAAAFSNQN
jgi:hypothetical protein